MSEYEKTNEKDSEEEINRKIKKYFEEKKENDEFINARQMAEDLGIEEDWALDILENSCKAVDEEAE